MTTSPQSTTPTPTQHIESCQGLVRSLAWKIHRKLPRSVELDDLISYGQLGLAEAARDYDPAKGASFSTYAHYRIRGAIFDGLAKMSWFSRYDYHASRYERMANEVLAHEQAAGESGGAGADVASETRWLGRTTSNLAMVYLATMPDEEGRRAESKLEDRHAVSPLLSVAAVELKQKLVQAVDTLPDKARRLIRATYFEGKTLVAAGQQIGISKSWASRLHEKALQQLAHALRQMGVEGGLDGAGD